MIWQIAEQHTGPTNTQVQGDLLGIHDTRKHLPVAKQQIHMAGVSGLVFFEP